MNKLMCLKNITQQSKEIRTPASLFIEDECVIRSPATLEDFNATQAQVPRARTSICKMHQTTKVSPPKNSVDNKNAKRRLSHVSHHETALKYQNKGNPWIYQPQVLQHLEPPKAKHNGLFSWLFK